MSRRVERRILHEYLARTNPHGVAKLALASDVSASTIEKARIGVVPKKEATRRKICDVIGVEESELFPVTAGRSRAS